MPEGNTNQTNDNIAPVALDMERLRLIGSVSTILRQQAGGLTENEIKISHSHNHYTYRTIL